MFHETIRKIEVAPFMDHGVYCVIRPTHFLVLCSVVAQCQSKYFTWRLWIVAKNVFAWHI